MKKSLNNIKLALKIYPKHIIKEVIFMLKKYGFNYSYNFFEDCKNKSYLNCLILIY